MMIAGDRWTFDRALKGTVAAIEIARRRSRITNNFFSMDLPADPSRKSIYEKDQVHMSIEIVVDPAQRVCREQG